MHFDALFCSLNHSSRTITLKRETLVLDFRFLHQFIEGQINQNEKILKLHLVMSFSMFQLSIVSWQFWQLQMNALNVICLDLKTLHFCYQPKIWAKVWAWAVQDGGIKCVSLWIVAFSIAQNWQNLDFWSQVNGRLLSNRIVAWQFFTRDAKNVGLKNCLKMTGLEVLTKVKWRLDDG